MVFRALIVLFSYGYSIEIEIYKIIEAIFLTLVAFFCHMRVFSQVKWGMVQVAQ